VKRLLSVFIDGLKPDSIEYMPFLNSIGHKARIETQLGYSVTCHANIYTGVWPDKHRLWLRSDMQNIFLFVIHCR